MALLICDRHLGFLLFSFNIKSKNPSFAANIPILFPLKTPRNLNFYSSWNHQKTTGFLMISGGIEVKVFCCFQKVWNENIDHTWFYLLRTNPTKWSNTLKQFVYNFPRNFLSVFDHFKNWHYLLRLLWWLFNLFFIVPKI